MRSAVIDNERPGGMSAACMTAKNEVIYER